LDRADPGADVEAAIARGDFSFVGVVGYVHSYPGADGLARAVVEGRCSERVVPYASEIIGSSVVARLNDVARDYARRYNRRLIERVGVEHLCSG
jgi:hypothetical protein